jgi:hypothetical protein
MASGGKEHRMVFDVRGKRRGVVKVVYAILAVLMGLSLFLLGAGGSLSSLFGGGSSTGSATTQFVEQAEGIERRLVKNPGDSDLLGNLTRVRINAGNSAVVEDSSTGVREYTAESREEFEKASAAWTEYLKATDNPSAGIAKVIAPTLNFLRETSRTPSEFKANSRATVEAQRLVAKQTPNLNSLSTLALYTFFTFEYATAEEIGDEAAKLTNSKPERESLEKLLEEYRKAAVASEKRIEEFEKAARSGSTESLENPLGGLGGGGLSE